MQPNPTNTDIPVLAAHPGARTTHPSSPGGDVVAGRTSAPLTPIPPNPTGGTASSSGPELAQLFHALKRRWLLATGLGLVLGGVAAVVVWLLLSPAHVAFMQLRLSANKPSIISDDPNAQHEFNTYLKSQSALIRSREVLNTAVTSDEARRLHILQSQVEPVAFLEEKLNVTHQQNNELVKVSLEWDDPDEARVLVRAIVDAYQKVIVNAEAEFQRENLVEVRKLYTARQNELRSRRDRLATIKKSLQTADSEQVQLKLQSMQAEVSTSQSQLSAINLRLLEATGVLQIHKAQEKALTTLEVNEEDLQARIDSDTKILQFKADMKPHEITMDAYKRVNKNTFAYQEASKEVNRLKAEIQKREEEIRRSVMERGTKRLRFEYDSKLAALENQQSLLVAQEKALRSQLQKLQGQVISINESSTEKEMLEQDIAQQETLLANLGNRIAMNELNQHAAGRVKIAGGPALEQRSHKKQILATILGFGATVLATCFGIAWWDYRRKKIRDVGDVGASIGIPVLGTIPASTDIELLLREEEGVQDELLIESINAIRTFLLRHAQESKLQTIMISSADPGEGKSVLAGLLASSLASAGRRTLLIDGDLRSPGLHELYEVSLEPGLSDVLAGDSDTIDAIQPTGVDGLMLMTAGQCDREVLGSLARNGMEGVLGKVKEEFDFIILDSHPVLHATDTLVMGQSADAVLVTVLQDVSQAPRALASAQRLSTMGMSILGAVVNGTRSAEPFAVATGYSYPAVA